jgi:cell division control protein 6
MPLLGGAILNSTIEIVNEVLSRPTVFKDESALSIEYIPNKLPHREDELRFLAQLFRNTLEKPGSMNQRVMVTGNVGTGKTVLVHRFGLDMMKAAKTRKINLHYVHVNCRECKGSSFMILKKVIAEFAPDFPQRGFSSEEFLDVLMDVLDDRNAYLILALDELESLITTEGASPLYNFTRIQEDRVNAPMRLSLICILREPEYLEQLDRSTLSTLQRNLIELGDYKVSQIETILMDRVELALKEGAIYSDTVKFISELASSSGDARYAIELAWRAGKYADAESSKEITSEHVRKAAGSIHPAFREDNVTTLTLHEKMLLLAISRILDQSNQPYATMGEVESVYKVVCEEYRKTPRAHTQLWKYMKDLSTTGMISTKISGKGVKGKTTLIGLTSTPASPMRKWLESILETVRKIAERSPKAAR